MCSVIGEMPFLMDGATLQRHSMAEMPKYPRSRPIQAPRSVEVLVFPGVQLLDVAGPLQAFATANDLARDRAGAPPYALRVVAPGIGPVITSAGLGLVTEPLPEPRGPASDTLIVAGGAGTYAALEDTALVTWIRSRASQARRVAAVCTGAFLLGAR